MAVSHTWRVFKVGTGLFIGQALGWGLGWSGVGAGLQPEFIFYECDHVFFCLVKRGRNSVRTSKKKGSSRVRLSFSLEIQEILSSDESPFGSAKRLTSNQQF